MERASRSMVRGITRSLSWFSPYPVVFEHGSGSILYDVDGNRYIDLFQNGLSLIHGHAYPPIQEALGSALARGTAWPGASDAQIEFAELLCARVPGAERVRFANTGTEATMLAVKLARAVTGKPIVIKAWDAYHGSYDDLEAGLNGRGELPGRASLATFGDLDSYRSVLQRDEGHVAAIMLEPVQFTGIVTAPPPGFITGLAQLAREAGVLLIVDDCLMFRLAEGGSAERYGIRADITCLGKWIGGGLPVGAVAASSELMEVFDPLAEHPLYHGGSFNGNLLGCTAGSIAVKDLTSERIGTMDARVEVLRQSVVDAGRQAGISILASGVSSVLGLYVNAAAEDGTIDWPATALLQLAAVTHGVYYGSGGEIALCTTITDEELEGACAGLTEAVKDVAAVLAK
jgi:glutamate-1-semialdehyde 2,1-aminomutase